MTENENDFIVIHGKAFSKNWIKSFVKYINQRTNIGSGYLKYEDLLPRGRASFLLEDDHLNLILPQNFPE